MRFLPSVILPVLMSVAGWAIPAAAQDAAHALAQKFAEEQKAKAPGVSTRKPAAAAAVKPGALAQAAKTAPPVQPKTTAAEDYEAEMLEAAREEAENRRKAQSEAAAKSAPASPPATAPPAMLAPPSVPAAAPAAAPGIKIEAKIKTPAVSAPAIAAPAVKAAAPAREPQAQEAAVKPAATAAADVAATASILVVLSHAADSEGSMPKTFDPIVCFGETCYVSGGYDAPARTITRKDALSTKNTITAGAGACAGKGRCAFRSVPVKSGSDLQIVDLGLVRHDKRDTVAANIDTTCGVDGPDLFCNKPLTAPDYRIWLVPEPVASAAGAKAIEHALADELPEENLTLDTDK